MLMPSWTFSSLATLLLSLYLGYGYTSRRDTSSYTIALLLFSLCSVLDCESSVAFDLCLSALQGEATYRMIKPTLFTMFNARATAGGGSNQTLLRAFCVAAFVTISRKDPVQVARLVASLGVAAWAVQHYLGSVLTDAIRMRSTVEYWEEDRGEEEEIVESMWRKRFRSWGKLLQLAGTKRAFLMLDRETRETEAVGRAMGKFLQSGRVDGLTLAVFAELSRQSVSNRNVVGMASRASLFFEKQLTRFALEQFTNRVPPLPFPLDPDGPIKLITLLIALLVLHKRLFKNFKGLFIGKASVMIFFVTKQLSRMSLVLYLLARFGINQLRHHIPPVVRGEDGHVVRPRDSNTPMRLNR